MRAFILRLLGANPFIEQRVAQLETHLIRTNSSLIQTNSTLIDLQRHMLTALKTTGERATTEPTSP